MSDRIGGYIRPGYDPIQVPNAPTLDSADAGGVVTFTAPSDTGGGSITEYTVFAENISSGAVSTATGTASPITVTGLTINATYAFTVVANNAFGPSAVSNSINATRIAQGQTAYTTAGTYTWVAPAGVTSVSLVAVGGGGGSNTYPASRTGGNGGGGGGLGYKNNLSVTAGNNYQVVVGDGGRGGYHSSSSIPEVIGNVNEAENGGSSSFNAVVYATGGTGGGNGPSGIYYGGPGGTKSNADGGGTGGLGGSNENNQSWWAFGGGAAGYSGNGGTGGTWHAGGSYNIGASGGSGGGAGGAADWSAQCGVGLLGEGTSGGINQAGSGGTQGNVGYAGGGASTPGTSVAAAMKGAPGGVRIIWPGATRSFPSTNTGDV